MSERQPSGRSSWVGFAALVLAGVAVVLATFAVMYHRQVDPVKAATDEERARFGQLTGLTDHPSANTLDERYTDANGDLVADAPTDPAKQLDPPTLTFSYLAVDGDEEFRPAFKELLAAIGAATGKRVEYVPYRYVTDQLRDLRDGKLDIAGLNTGAVPLGVCAAGFVPLVQPADASGSAAYQVKIIVPADSPINSLADLRGHELTLTEPNSNSGYKAPLVLLRENKLNPGTDYLTRYSGGQTQSIDGIKSKLYEAAAVAGDVLEREQSRGHIAPADYRVIYTSDQTFPAPAIGCTSALRPALVAKVRDAMLKFSWKGTGLDKAFASEGKTQFVPADYRKSWAYVRLVDQSIGTSYALPATPAVTTTRPATRPVGK